MRRRVRDPRSRVGLVATLGVVGSGNIGGTVARLATDAGYDVVLSNSRGPETLAGLVEKLGPRARAGTAAEASAAGDLVLVSVPLKAVPTLAPAPFAGKVVMDTNNYYPQRDGHFAELDDDSTTGSELLARHLAGAKVVKVFNNIFFKHLGALTRPHGAADRSALAIAGDDADAKAAVTEFLDKIGYDVVDAGPLGAGGRRFQVNSRGYGAIYGDFGDADGTPLPAAQLAALINA
jgi:8-hydroxy-5-deazaflavin:NADPH oxidoreductase